MVTPLDTDTAGLRAVPSRLLSGRAIYRQCDPSLSQLDLDFVPPHGNGTSASRNRYLRHTFSCLLKDDLLNQSHLAVRNGVDVDEVNLESPQVFRPNGEHERSERGLGKASGTSLLIYKHATLHDWRVKGSDQSFRADESDTLGNGLDNLNLDTEDNLLVPDREL